MAFEVAPLPFEKTALEPVMSKETLEFHYEKHHKGYAAKLTSLLDGKPEASKSLVELVKSTSGAVFNNAAQVYNHDFFWQSLKPQGGGAPSGKLGELIARDFGSFVAFRDAFIAAGMGRFGSGWVWLVVKDGKLALIDTQNAETPLTQAGTTPLLVADVWEHAYYIDFRNARQAFLEAFLDKLANWDFATAQLALVS